METPVFIAHGVHPDNSQADTVQFGQGPNVVS